MQNSVIHSALNKGKIYLVPTILNSEALYVIPAYVHAITNDVEIFFVENERTARRYLRKTGYEKNFDNILMVDLNANAVPPDLDQYMQLVLAGKNAAVLSEAGVPAVADPGTEVVRIAHAYNIQVIPLTGPSSIILSLMASGLNGQRFSFNGYLPVKSDERRKVIKQLEHRMETQNETQIFIETPYRNNALIADVLQTCKNETLFCIAASITGPNEKILTKKIAEWKKLTYQLEKVPAIFLLGR
ncbi:MAG: SAM-dependent methyltransferase [Chitinophagales bacterium]